MISKTQIAALLLKCVDLSSKGPADFVFKYSSFGPYISIHCYTEGFQNNPESHVDIGILHNDTKLKTIRARELICRMEMIAQESAQQEQNHES